MCLFLTSLPLMTCPLAASVSNVLTASSLATLQSKKQMLAHPFKKDPEHRAMVKEGWFCC